MQTTINLAALMTVLQPYFLTAISAFVTVLTPMIGARLYAWLGLRLTAADWSIINSTAVAAAGKIWAAADQHISTMVVTPGNALITDAANEAITLIPDIANRQGLTPEALGSLITSKLGGMQALAAPVIAGAPPFGDRTR